MADLQGREMMKEVYVRPPDEVKSNKVWHLKKMAYGLKDAQKHWYENLIGRTKRNRWGKEQCRQEYCHVEMGRQVGENNVYACGQFVFWRNQQHLKRCSEEDYRKIEGWNIGKGYV